MIAEVGSFTVNTRFYAIPFHIFQEVENPYQQLNVLKDKNPLKKVIVHKGLLLHESMCIVYVSFVYDSDHSMLIFR